MSAQSLRRYTWFNKCGAVPPPPFVTPHIDSASIQLPMANPPLPVALGQLARIILISRIISWQSILRHAASVALASKRGYKKEPS